MTEKLLGAAIPQSLLVQATEVITQVSRERPHMAHRRRLFPPRRTVSVGSKAD
jgi:hypothetical protein